MSASPGNRFRLVAMTTAVGLLVVSGMGYRFLADRLARPTESIPLPRGNLERLPKKLGAWTGRDVPLSRALIRATDADDHVNRIYVRHAGTETVSVFIAYGVRARDLAPHRPEVCYPGAGWSLRDKHVIRPSLADGTPLACQVYRFARGGLDAEAVTVLNYYIVDGQVCPDVSLLRSKAWRGSGGVQYTAQVQIAAAGNILASSDSAEASVRDFAVDSAKAIRVLLPDAGTDSGEVGG